MNYEEVLDYLYRQLPMFHRIGAAAYKADLSNTEKLMELLQHPERKFRSVHIAGTNGKGSISHMLAAIFQQCGFKTGLYTSPHLLDFRERIRINGEMIPKEKVIAFVEKYKIDFEPIGLSFFEWTVGLCFQFFAEEKVDIAIIETGLGGRLDSTNVILPELSVITNISNDHKALLGDTLQKIAGEKAGIIKKGIPVVVGERQSEVSEVFSARSVGFQSDLTFASDHYIATSSKVNASGQIFSIKKNGSQVTDSLQSDLPGSYQAKNICTVLHSVDELRRRGFQLPEQDVRYALAHVRELTGLQGRWQVLGQDPLVICDVGHNEAGVKYIIDQLSALTFDKLYFIIGMVSDKDSSSVLELLPKKANYIFTKADLPRSLDADQLAVEAERKGLKGIILPKVSEAVRYALAIAGKNDVVFIGGSTFVVAEALKEIQSTTSN